jgi:transposase
VSADAWHRISSATRTPSRWPARASRRSSSNASSATPTWASRRSICRASTTPRSSTPSTPADPRWSQPLSLREWLPEGHLAWFVIDAVGQLDLSAFSAAYRADGHGRAAHDPAMMVALLLYAYAIGERSSQRIERRCVEDVATLVICANQAPDHTTIARFRQRHAAPLAELFGEGLAQCAEAGLVRLGSSRRWHEGGGQRVGAGDARLRADRARDSRGGRRGRRRGGRAFRRRARR